jgi:ribose transport system ATP-binding protein
VTGLVGSGKTELGRLLFGAERIRHGEVSLEGNLLELMSPADAIRAGIGYVPPERRTQGGISDLTAAENVTLPALGAFWKGGRLRRRAETGEVEEWMSRTNVVPADPHRKFATFSGGNQQKLVFSKWFRLNPRVLILDEPTQGVDVGAARDLYSLVQHAAADGLALVLLSSEWEDMARICHRVIVLDRGAQVADLRGADLTYDRIAAAAFGNVNRTAAA